MALVFDTKHALNLLAAGDMEVLVHVGIDTVQLNGAPFDIKVSAGDHLKKGDLIGTFDMAKITEAGYRCTTPVVVANSDDYHSFDLLVTGEVTPGQPVMKVQ